MMQLFAVIAAAIAAYEGTSIYSRSLDLVETELRALKEADRDEKAKIIKQKISIKSKF